MSRRKENIPNPVRLDEEQSGMVRNLAETLGVPMADVLRVAVDQLLLRFGNDDKGVEQLKALWVEYKTRKRPSSPRPFGEKEAEAHLRKLAARVNKAKGPE